MIFIFYIYVDVDACVLFLWRNNRQEKGKNNLKPQFDLKAEHDGRSQMNIKSLDYER